MKHKPKVTVVVPALNEEAHIARCLSALTSQDYTGPLEVIVVNNGSKDQTADIAGTFPVKLINEPEAGVVHARIKGFTQAEGEIIISTDADTVAPPDWVRSYVERFSDEKVDAVIGRFEYHDASVWKEHIGAFLTPLGLKVDRLIGGHFSGCNFAIRKAAYKGCGGFDKNLHYGEDFELTNRLRRHGYTTVVARDITVSTSARQFSRHFRKVMFNLIWLSVFERPAIK
ncbi:MAG TPA: glycosyltransferase [Candidatus Saccharimonadales bacterium]|nr:glycosyltransferase [Candidatus Saccharimonadales bacterium]